MRGRRWVIAGLLAMSLFAAACGSDDKKEGSSATTAPSGGSPAAGAATAAPGAAPTQARVNIKRGGTLVVALENNPRHFDPMLQNDVPGGDIVANVFEGLYKYNDKLEPQPWLAEKVENPDNLTWIFKIRPGVKFHDGSDLNAEAVKFSMDRIRNNTAGARYGDTRQITDVIVVDPMTVKVTLSEPFAPFPSRLTGGLGYIVSPKAVKDLGEEKFNQTPVGTGPFKFVEFKNDNYVKVAKFDGYWRKGADDKALPYLDGIEWRIITESTNRLTAVQAGDVDLIRGGAVRDADLPVLKKDSNIKMDQKAGFSFAGLWLTTSKPPFDNKALRQALYHAIDRDEVIKVIYEGNREKANGPIPPPLAWARPDKDFYPYDQAKAKAKLAEGGQPNGFAFEFWISAGDSLTKQLAELYQAQLKKVGITMNIQEGDFNGVVIPKLQKQESNAYALGLSGGVDPDQWVGNTFGKGGTFNFFPYENAQVNDLIKKGRETLNKDERAKIYKDAVTLIMEDSPYIFVTHGVDRYVCQKKVEGCYTGVKATSGYSEYWKN